VAAVLIALVVRETGLTVLLTQRAEHLNGSRRPDQLPRRTSRAARPTDAAATALREAQEEVDLDRRSMWKFSVTLPEYHDRHRLSRDAGRRRWCIRRSN
jgi:8-oxo-dGTP pyrophosphatase MutT (NUDIX family)